MKIYRDGREIYELKDYKQIGRFMEVAIIEATIKDTLPIDIKVGDYVIFDYNNLKYTLYDVYPAKKQARSTTYQEAFVYDLKFKADTEQLAICPFLDLVPNDNGLVYSSLPSFSTFENVYGIAARLQANMDYLYPNQWQFRIVETDDAELRETLLDAREFAVGGESCLAGLKKIYDIWGVGFIHTFEDGLNVITIGKSAGKTSLFRYGKGMGLRTIKRSPQNNEQLCTRAYVFGGTRNIPARWYNNKGYIGEAQYAPNLMIPPSKWVDGIPQGAYIDAIFDGENRIEKYGLKIKTLNYDGSDSKKDEIYPSIEKMTAKNIRDAKAEIGENIYVPSTTLYPDEERMDMVLEGSSVPDDGTPTDPGYVLYSDQQVQWTEEQSETITIAEMTGETKYKLLNVQRTINLCTFEIEKVAKYRFEEILDFVKFKKNDLESTISASLYLQTPSGEYIKIRDLAFTEELESGLQIPDSLHSLTEVGKYTLVLKFNVSWSFDWVVPQIGDEVYLRYTIQSAAVTLSRGEKALDNFFKIKIKQIGFNLNDYTASSGAYKNIHFRSGMCSGRSFNIAQCTYIEEEDAWELKCKRIVDSSLSQRFPNSIFNVAKDDRFVLLDINMPDLYVYAAMQRLYDTALRDLKYFSVPQYVIEPQIDNLQMARSPQILREGMYMPLDDLDISIINEEVLIDSVTIANKGTELRTFEVTLRNDKVYNKYNKLADRLAELESISQKTASNNAVSPVDDTKESEVMPPSSGITAKDVEIIVEPLTEDIETLKENDAEQDKKLLEFASMWHLDKQNNAVRTSLNLIVEGGGAFGKGSGGGGDVPTTSDVVIKFEGDDDVYTPVNGVITLPAYPEGGGEGGGIDEAELEQYLKTNQYAKKSDIPSLAGYATEAWVNQQGFLTQHQDLSAYAKSEDVANTYATKSALKGVSDSVGTLRTDFDNLNDVLNGNVGGVIDSWNEVVSFLDGYSQSDDLAAILSGMNTDIANRVLIEDFEKLEEAINPLFGYFDANGNANNALKLGGHAAEYFATADALNTHIKNFNTYKTTTDKRLGDLEALWYMDDEGNVHTRHNIIVEGGGAFGKGSGGGGDVPSGGGIDETQLWDILGQSGTQAIHSSHIPDLSGKYLSLIGGGVVKGNGAYSPLVVDADLGQEGVGFRLALKGSNKSLFAWDRGVGTYIYDSDSKKYMGIYNSNPYFYDGATQQTLIHSGNYPSYALPLSGGTLHKSNDNTPLVIKGTTAGAWIAYRDSDSVFLGSIGVQSDKKAYFYETSLGSVELLHSSNYSNYALPKSGGTMQGDIILPERKYIRDADNTAIFGYNTTQGLLVGSPSKKLSLRSSENATLNGNTLYHTGNFNPNDYLPLSGGTVTGTIRLEGKQNDFSTLLTIHHTALLTLLTDLAEGHNASFSIGKYSSSYNLGYFSYHHTADSSRDNYIRIGLYSADDILNITARKRVGINTTAPEYDLHVAGSFRANNGVFYDTNRVPLVVTSTNSAGPIIQLYGDSATLFAELGHYPKATNSNYGTFLSNKESNIGIILGSDRKVYISEDVNSLEKTHTLIHSGNIGSYNAGSATKLQDNTAFTAWGQTFFENGVPKSANGALYDINGNEFLYASGSLVRIGSGTTGAGQNTFLDGNNIYLRYGTSYGIGLFLNYSGNVLIGSTTDNGAKLQVSGSIISNATKDKYNVNYSVYYTGIHSYMSDMANGDNIDIAVGKAYAYKQLAYFGYHRGSSNDDSYLRMGLHSVDDVLTIRTSGNVLMGTTTDNSAYKLQVATSTGGGIDIRSSTTYGGINISQANGYRWFIGVDNTKNFYLTTGSSHKIDINENGFVGINKTKPTRPLDIKRDSTSDGDVVSLVSSAGWCNIVYQSAISKIWSVGANQDTFYWWNSQKSGTVAYIDNAGNLAVTGGGAFGSDIRYKDITSYRQIDLETIVKAPLFSFKWTDREDKVEHLGTSAQYWLSTQFKDAVNITNPKFYHLDYGALGVGIGISVAREMIKVKSRVEILEDRVNQLEKELAQYRRA